MPESALSQLSEINSMEDLDAKIAALQGAIAVLDGKIASSLQSQGQMSAAIEQMTTAKAEMETLLNEMQALNDAVPAAFETAKADYLAELDAKSGEIEGIYQSTINEGYRSIYLTASVSAAIAILLLMFYKKKKPIAEITAELEA